MPNGISRIRKMEVWGVLITGTSRGVSGKGASSLDIDRLSQGLHFHP
jgi:hypothetical protein